MDQTNTLARWLHDAGYRTGARRQVHERLRPRAGPSRSDGTSGGPPRENPFLMYDYTLNHNGMETAFGIAPSDYKTDVITRISREFVEDAAPEAQPFYLQVWYTAPHVELGTDSRGQQLGTTGAPPGAAPRERLRDGTRCREDPSFAEADVTDKPRGSVSSPEIGHEPHGDHDREVPHAAGLAGVGRRGRSARSSTPSNPPASSTTTLFVFTSDNGYTHGEHRIAFSKSVIYEPSIRVPFYVAGPGFPEGAGVSTPGDVPRSGTDVPPPGRRRSPADDGRHRAAGVAREVRRRPRRC